jgi:hypothetical protein
MFLSFWTTGHPCFESKLQTSSRTPYSTLSCHVCGCRYVTSNTAKFHQARTKWRAATPCTLTACGCGSAALANAETAAAAAAAVAKAAAVLCEDAMSDGGAADEAPTLAAAETKAAATVAAAAAAKAKVVAFCTATRSPHELMK